MNLGSGSMEKMTMKQKKTKRIPFTSILATFGIVTLFGTALFAGEPSQQKSDSKAEQKTDQKPSSKSNPHEEKNGSKAEKASHKSDQKGAVSVRTLRNVRQLLGDQKSSQKGLLKNQ